MKRKREAGADALNGNHKKVSKAEENFHDSFRKGLFEAKALKQYKSSYAGSEPYTSPCEVN